MFLTVMLRCGRRRGAKSSQKFKKVDLFVFPSAANVIFARNGQTRSKIDQRKAGPYQIDARGSHATKIFEFWSYRPVQTLENQAKVEGRPRGHF